ncbi:MAG: substrate-binding domain-containing protein [Gammaproteobacteria bacterium]|nr:substrate-binding domain-containing protein [Gammaproteobacteria bacterium]
MAADDIRVPEHISVVGFDDIEVAEQIVPSLSTLRAPVEEIARLAFAELMAQKDANDAMPQHHSVQAELVMRQTTKTLSTAPAAEGRLNRAVGNR